MTPKPIRRFAFATTLEGRIRFSPPLWPNHTLKLPPGGLTQFADVNGIRIMRREGDRQTVLPFEYGRVVRGEKLEQNVLLRAGDVVVVP